MTNDFYSFLEESISKFPSRTAIVGTQGHVLTYRAIAQIIEAFTVRAAETGIGRGDKVWFLAGSYAFDFCLMVALSRLGAVSVMTSSPDDLDNSDVQIDATIISNQLPDVSKYAALDVPKKITFDQTWLAASQSIGTSGNWPGFENSTDDALILGSSGTSGQKKIFSHSVSIFRSRLSRFRYFLGNEPVRRLVSMTLRTAVSLNSHFLTLSNGGQISTFPQSGPPALKFCKQHQIGSIFGSPAFIVGLVKGQEEQHIPLPYLKSIVIGGGAISVAAVGDVKKLVCKNVRIQIGSSEIGPVAGGNFDDIVGTTGATGFIGPWVEVGTVDDEGNSLPAGEAGKLRFRVDAEARISNYLNGRDEDRYPFEDGWFFSSDIGYCTEEGLLVLSGRRSHMINIGGRKLSPETVEQEAEGQDFVLQAGAIGRTSKQGFDEICIAIVGKEGFSVGGFLRNFGTEFGHIQPHQILVVDELPLNTGGKIDRVKLRTYFADS